MKHPGFVHLHVHTQYSLLDGAIRLEDLLKKAKDYQMPAIAMTDHGNMFGAISFYQLALKHGIKPIIGCELYVAPNSRLDKGGHHAGESARHLIVLAKDVQGYKNLMKLTTAGYLEGFYYKPRIDKEILKEHHDGMGARSKGLDDITGKFDASVRNDGNAVEGCGLIGVANGAHLWNADPGDNARGADGTGPDADFDGIDARFDESLCPFSRGDVAGNEFASGKIPLRIPDGLDHPGGMPVGGVDDDHVRPGVQQSLHPRLPVQDADGRADPEPPQ